MISSRRHRAVNTAAFAAVSSLALVLAGCTTPADEAHSPNSYDAAVSTSASPSATPAPSKDNFYIADTSYEGITSVVSQEETDTVTSYVEIPDTEWPEINKVIKTEVDELREHFRSVTRDFTPEFDGKFSERVSYNLIYRGDGVLTLALNTLFDTQGASPERHHRVITFDLHDDARVGVANLFDGAIDSNGDVVADHAGLQEFVEKAREQLRIHYGASEVFPEDLTAESLDGFALGDDGRSLDIHFDDGTVSAYSAGRIELSIDPHKLQHKPDSALATRVLGDDFGTGGSSSASGKAHTAQAQPGQSEKIAQPSQSSQPAQVATQHDAQQAPRIPGAPRVALTFDDGPAANTNRLLDTLAQYNAKATFFTIGSSVDASPSTVARTLNEGHAVGNHTYNHPDLTTLGADEVRNELSQGNQAIANATGGHTPTMLRPPYGATNHTVNNIAAEFGMANIIWSVDTRDWQDRDSALVCNRAVTNAYDGAVILLHDLHATSVDAMPCILDSLSSQGYEFVTAEQLFGGVKPGLNYYGG